MTGAAPRLGAKDRQLSVVDRVVFAGYVPGHERADHYRLADALVTPGRGEGIVYREALACGVPAVVPSTDASRGAVRDGMLGVVIDPDDGVSIVSGIRDALDVEKGMPQVWATFCTSGPSSAGTPSWTKSSFGTTR